MVVTLEAALVVTLGAALVVTLGAALVVTLGAALVVVTLGAALVVVTLGAALVVVTLKAAAEVETASAERTCQVEFHTLMTEAPAPLHLGRVRQIVSLSIPVPLADCCLRPFVRRQQRLILNRIVLRLRAIVQRKFRVRRSQHRRIRGI